MTDAADRGKAHEKPRAKASHYAEYGALRTVTAALAAVGLRRASTAGAWLGSLGFRPLGIRRAVVQRQVHAALPGLSDAQVQSVSRNAYRHLGRTFIETALIASKSRDEVLALFEGVDGWENVASARESGTGVLFVSGHVGNWELAGAYIAARGIPFAAVARHMANPIFEDYITRMRERIGMRIIKDDEAVRQVPRAIRSGESVGFLFDQGALGLASTWVPFFGRLAKTPRGPGVFALRLGVPVIFAAAIRQPSGKYRMMFVPVHTELTGERDVDVDRIIASCTAILEQVVRAAPEQYFWHHRRWKHQQPGTPPELGDPL